MSDALLFHSSSMERSQGAYLPAQPLDFSGNHFPRSFQALQHNKLLLGLTTRDCSFQQQPLHLQPWAGMHHARRETEAPKVVVPCGQGPRDRQSAMGVLRAGQKGGEVPRISTDECDTQKGTDHFSMQKSLDRKSTRLNSSHPH